MGRPGETSANLNFSSHVPKAGEPPTAAGLEKAPGSRLEGSEVWARVPRRIHHEHGCALPPGRVGHGDRPARGKKKTDPNCVGITIGGNLIDYLFELTTCTADLTTSKVM